ncbi:MAG TPA: pyridoxal phosphate-dependent aminotransferase [Vicinamibacterales bacterium]|nr:pyridoxal phosphate-dependent aminotransferase [Vicinamibacterales bacterium]
MFSGRLPRTLTTNRLADAVGRLRAAGRSFIDLTESNPTRAGFDYPGDLLAPLSHAASRVYAPAPLGSMEAREAVAREYERRGLTVAPDRVVLTSSTSEAYSWLFKLLTDAGDEVLVPRPSYPLFDHLTRLDLVTTRPYDLEYHGSWSIDFAAVERALTPRTRAVLIVSPNNPTGSFVSVAELDRLSALCAPRGVALIADEVFADYALEPDAAPAAGRVSARRDVLSFALGGLSKTVGLPQLKLGWMAVSGPDALVAAALARLEIIGDAYLPVSTPVQVAAASLLAAGGHVRRQIAARVVANYRALRSAVAQAPSCAVLRDDAGWYAVLQVPTFESEEQLVVSLLERDGVLTHPGYFFDFARGSFLVVSLLPPPDVFADGLNRVLRHFACSAGMNVRTP